MAVCCRICLIHVWRTFVLYGERDSDAYGTYHMTLTHTCYPRSVVHSHLEMNCFSVLLISFTTVCLVIVILFALLLITVCCVAECCLNIGRNCCSRYNASLASLTSLNKSSTVFGVMHELLCQMMHGTELFLF